MYTRYRTKHFPPEDSVIIVCITKKRLRVTPLLFMSERWAYVRFTSARTSVTLLTEDINEASWSVHEKSKHQSHKNAQVCRSGYNLRPRHVSACAVSRDRRGTSQSANSLKQSNDTISGSRLEAHPRDHLH